MTLSAIRVAHRYLLAVSERLMDLTLRMKILEGALGVSSGTYSRNMQAISAALEELPQQQPSIKPTWFAPQVVGFYDALMRGAREGLGAAETWPTTAEELVQDTIIGMRSVTMTPYKDIFRRAGEKNSAYILSGHLHPKGLLPMMQLFMLHRTTDVLKRQYHQVRHFQEGMPGKDHAFLHEPDLHERLQQVPPKEFVLDQLEQSPLTVLMSLISGPQGKTFKKWVWETIRLKASVGQLAVMRAWMRDPHLTNAGLGESPEVQKVLERRISGQMAGRYRDQMVEILRDELEQHPEVLDSIERFMNLRALGYRST